MFPGRVYKFSLEGKLLGQFGISGYKPGQFGWVHALSCVSENEVWTGELLTWRVQKFILHPERASPPVGHLELPNLPRSLVAIKYTSPEKVHANS